MSAAKKSPETKKDLPERIRDWLEGQGYPLEMWVASVLEASGFDVTVSDRYIDPTTQEQREIDVTGAIGLPVLKGQADVRVYITIECKLSTDKPWIVFLQGDKSKDWILSPRQTPMSERLSRIWYYPESPEGGRMIVRRSVDSKIGGGPPNVGYNIVQAFKESNQDATFKALTSAVNASMALVKKSDNVPVFVKRSHYLLRVAVPAIVVDGRLFECTQGDSEQLELCEVNYTSVQWKELSQSGISPLVHVCTRAGLSSFISEITEASKRLAGLADDTQDLLNDRPPRKRLRVSEY